MSAFMCHIPSGASVKQGIYPLYYTKNKCIEF